VKALLQALQQVVVLALLLARLKLLTFCPAHIEPQKEGQIEKEEHRHTNRRIEASTRRFMMTQLDSCYQLNFSNQRQCSLFLD
jgi:hypothetical protein